MSRRRDASRQKRADENVEWQRGEVMQRLMVSGKVNTVFLHLQQADFLLPCVGTERNGLKNFVCKFETMKIISRIIQYGIMS